MHTFIDLTGQRFSRLVVLESTDKRSGNSIIWKCLCDCGNVTYVSSHNLRRKDARSCGCLQKEITSMRSKKNLKYERFGRLIAVEPTEKKDSNRNIIWKCVRDCGNITYVSSSELNSGNTKSCGCLQKDIQRELHITHGLTGTKEYKKTQNRRRRELELLYDSEYGIELEQELENFFPSCVICGSTDYLENDHVIPLSKGHGLVPGNAVVLCREHNRTKLAKSLDKLPQEWAEKIIQAAKAFEEYWNTL